MKKSSRTEIVIPTGIKRALVYNGINTIESYLPVGLVIKRISENIDERLVRMKQRCSA